MQRHLRNGFLFLWILLVVDSSVQSLSANWVVTAGPEIYHMRRWRTGGTVQQGRLDGGRGTLEWLRGNAPYLGATILYAQGDLKGHNSSQRSIYSTMTDFIVEGRAGFTFQIPTSGSPYFTIYSGYGYFQEKNAFSPPSPLPITFNDTIHYTPIGFLSGVNILPLLSMGLNFEVRFMLDGQSEVTDDPQFDDEVLAMSDEVHIRVELPIQAHLWGPESNCSLLLSPFYEFRHFGGREGYPFDYLDTKFSLYGIEGALVFCF